VAAIKAAQLGLKVTCVEGRGALGGTCLNVGCIPSKALLHSSHIYHGAKSDYSNYGVMVDNVQIDIKKMMAQKDKAVTGLTKGVEGLFKKNKVSYVKGYGKLAPDGKVEVKQDDGSTVTLSGKNTIIATGSAVASLPGLEIDEDRIVSSTGALNLKEIPKRLIVVGGGYIGLEMGSVWGRLGAQVTVVEFLDRIVPTMDGEIRKAFQRTLTKQGFKWKLGMKVLGGRVDGDTVKLEIEPAKGGDKEELEADVVLVSAGRKPFTEGLGLEDVGVKTDNRGRIEVDDHFNTSVKGVYAIGDVIPGPMLAHKAEEDGFALAEQLAGLPSHVDYNTVPGIIYTDPEVASVGKTEEQLKEEGVDYKVGKFSFMANSRARTVDTADGMVKFLTDAKTDKILGAHIMGPNAGELIPEAVLAMSYGGSTEDIARTCHGHPTLSEAVKEAALASAFGKAIHA
jgi:dihydrolipoamide dehydrogenase